MELRHVRWGLSLAMFFGLACKEGVTDLDPGGETQGRVDRDTGETATSPQEAYCGNGISELPELCDDGNQIIGDGCNPDCVLSGEPLWARVVGGVSTSASLVGLGVTESGELRTGIAGWLRLKDSSLVQAVRVVASSAEGVERWTWGAENQVSLTVHAMANAGENSYLLFREGDAGGKIGLWMLALGAEGEVLWRTQLPYEATDVQFPRMVASQDEVLAVLGYRLGGGRQTAGFRVDPSTGELTQNDILGGDELDYAIARPQIDAKGVAWIAASSLEFNGALLLSWERGETARVSTQLERRYPEAVFPSLDGFQVLTSESSANNVHWMTRLDEEGVVVDQFILRASENNFGDTDDGIANFLDPRDFLIAPNGDFVAIHAPTGQIVRLRWDGSFLWSRRLPSSVGQLTKLAMSSNDRIYAAGRTGPSSEHVFVVEVAP